MSSVQAPPEAIQVGALGVRFLVEADDANGSVAMFECVVPARARMPAPHSHDAFEETIYGLSGVTTWTLDGRVMELGPGDALCIRRGVVHGFENLGDEDARVLAVATPGLMSSAYFREIADVLAASAGPPDLSRVGEIMRRHGLTPAPPPAS